MFLQVKLPGLLHSTSAGVTDPGSAGVNIPACLCTGPAWDWNSYPPGVPIHVNSPVGLLTSAQTQHSFGAALRHQHQTGRKRCGRCGQDQCHCCSEQLLRASSMSQCVSGFSSQLCSMKHVTCSAAAAMASCTLIANTNTNIAGTETRELQS